MKRIFLYLFCCFFAIAAIKLNAFAQKKAKKKISYHAKIGDKYFENSDYYFAAQSYQKAIQENKQDFYAHFRLGETYQAMFDYAKAEKAYQVVAEAPAGNQEFPLAKFWYGLMLKTNGKYQKAKEAFANFKADFKPQTPEEKSYVNWAELEFLGTLLALELLQKPVRNFELKPLPAPLNSKSSDYAPVIFKNDTTLVITSARPGNKGNNTDPRSGDMYSDNLRFYKDEAGKWQPLRLRDEFENIINTEVSEGAGVFNADYTKYYYTNCAAAEYCAIYVSYFQQGKWQKPIKLNENINPKNVSTKQPALSPTGDTLFFVMEKTGGKGQNDIWMAVKTGTGENWQPPINLTQINTPYVEMSPCFYVLQGEPVLFFASDGRESLGGLDIFMAKGKNFEYIVNVGLPFNSSRDDFYFSVGERKGYLSSNREGGAGKDDIYTFNTTSRAFLIQTIAQDSITGYDSLVIAQKLKEMEWSDPNNIAAAEKQVALKTATPTRQEEWKLSPMETERLMQLSAAELAIIAQQKELEAIEARKNAMEALEKQKALKQATPQRQQDVNLAALSTHPTQQLTAEELLLIAQRKEYEAAEIRKLAQLAAEREINLAKAQPERKQDVNLAHLATDQQARLTPEQQAGLIANKSNAQVAAPAQQFSNIPDKAITLKTKSVQRRQDDVRLDNMKTDETVDFSEIKPFIAPKFNYYLDALTLFEGKKIKSRTLYSSTYFKFDDDHIATLNEQILDNLIKYAHQYPDTKIEIAGYTDDIGSENYNQELAYRRAKSVWDYMVKKGVNHQQLIINPIGIERSNTEQEQSAPKWKSRRTDFYIIALESN